jgi:TRAP-type C4-dicarboxylate transport system permease small subunit
MQRGQHTVLDYFLNQLTPRVRSLVLIITNGIGIVLFLYLIKLSLVLVPNAQLQSSPGLGLSLGWVFVAVPIGSALIILPMLRDLLAALRGLWPKRS